MIQSVTVINFRNESMEIDFTRPDLSGFAITEISGLGPVKANINRTDVATNDGSIFNSARLDSRNIVIKMQFYGDDIEAIRQKSYKYFPIKKQITLIFKTDYREAKITGYIESNQPNIFSKEENTQISIICPDPYFYSTEANSNKTDLYSIEPLFEFPYSNESLIENLTEFSVINVSTVSDVIYKGDYEIGIIITIHAVGPASGISIYNVNTLEHMIIDTDKISAITGNPLQAGDDIIINTIRGNKSIKLLRNGVYTNILNCIGKDSDWFQLSKGKNTFSCNVESGGNNLRFTITNDVIYEGI